MKGLTALAIIFHIDGFQASFDVERHQDRETERDRKTEMVK